jgi:DNA-binding MarR family transcriptional regulator
MIDGLERGGIVTREPSPDDRRVVAVRLTAKGGRCARAKRDHMHARRRALYESLEPQDRARAARVLRGIAEMIDEL